MIISEESCWGVQKRGVRVIIRGELFGADNRCASNFTCEQHPLPKPH
jgi:hypothetical protein